MGFELLQISSIALIFIALNQTISGSLQGIGKIYAPATGLLMGCIAKFILNVLLIRQPGINIYGAPISSVACQVISFSYGFSVLKKNTGVKLSFKKYILKPLLASFAMGVSAIAVYKGVMYVLKINVVAVFAAIVVAVAVYAVCVMLLKIMTEDEIEQLPAGGKLLSILKKSGFYKKKG